MRRVFSVAFPGLMALAAMVMIAPSAIAQRGGGGHGGGGHAGGFSGGGHAGGFGGGFASHGFGGGYSGRSLYSGRASYVSRGDGNAPRASYAIPARSYAQAYRSGSRDRYRRPYRSPYRGYGGYGYPYGIGNSWGVLPWDLGYPDFNGYDNGYVDQPTADASQQPVDAGQPLPDDDRPPYAAEPYPYPQAPAVAAAPVSDEPALTLIFNDGHQQSIRNYALTSNYILVLDNAANGREQRIPLTDLNVPATEKAAQQAGLDFTPPA
ncbi:MAG: hypothetical protein WA414_02150 [Acidobacteriaceae bacterium]